MGKISLLLLFLALVALSGCASMQESSGGQYEEAPAHYGHHH